MGNPTLGMAMIFVWILNVMMIFSQLAITNMQPDGLHWINCSGTIMKGYASDDCSALSGPLTDNLEKQLPGGAVPNSNFFIVDWITSAASWIGQQKDIFTQVAAAPYTMLKSIPMFQNPVYAPFAAVIGVMWWGLSILLIVAFIFGR